MTLNSSGISGGLYMHNTHKTAKCPLDRHNNLQQSTVAVTLDMGRNSADTKFRPNIQLGSPRQHETIQPNFRKHSASLWLRIGGAFFARRWH